MRAWYDITALDRGAAQDEAGIRASQQAITTLIRRENERGIATEHIVLAGFSQGGAMALVSPARATRRGSPASWDCPATCCRARGSRPSARAANQSTPLFIAHGSQDPVVAVALGEEASRQMQAAGYAVEWHTYSMPHSVSPQEVVDIAAWLRRVL